MDNRHLATEFQLLGTATVTKSMLAKQLYDHIGLTKKEANVFIDAFFDIIAETLINGEEVHISGFGNFNLRDKKTRPGRNPRSDLEAVVSARRVTTFRAGKKLRYILSSHSQT